MSTPAATDCTRQEGRESPEKAGAEAMTPEIEKYIIKPAGIIRDKRLTSIEADFLCLIWQLQNAGGCRASNQYFAEYFSLSRIRAVQTISSLRKKGFIETAEKKSGKETIERTITVLDEGSKKNLLRSKDSLQEVVRKTYRGSKKNYNHTLEVTIEYDNKEKKLKNLTVEDLELWGKSYLGLNIEREIQKMESWLDANPNRRPKSDYKRFINNWLSRAKPDTSGGVCATRVMDEDEADELFRKAGIAQ